MGVEKLMSRARVIDGHVDLPIFVREAYGNDINKINLEKQVSGKSIDWDPYLGEEKSKMTEKIEVPL